MLSAEEIVNQQDRETRAWHQAAAGAAKPDSGTDWLSLVSGQHRANFELWHIEDESARSRRYRRRDRRGEAARGLHQPAAQRSGRGAGQRLAGLAGARGLPNPAAALHSETPGLISTGSRFWR